MIKKVFSVYDSKAKFFGPPMFFFEVAEAVRLFGDAVGDKRSNLSRHPEDYILFEIGTFDDHSGELVSINSVNHGLGSDYLKVAKDDKLTVLPEVIQ